MATEEKAVEGARTRADRGVSGHQVGLESGSRTSEVRAVGGEKGESDFCYY